MKKIIALLLALVMGCMLIPAVAEAADVTGDWLLSQLVMEGSTINVAALGMSMTLTLNEDGTAIMITDDGDSDPETAEGEWTLEGETVTFASEGDSIEFVLVDDTLQITSEGAVLVFARELAEDESIPVVVPAESEEVFLGTWNITAAHMYGMMFTAEAIGVESSLVIEPGTVAASFGGDTEQSPSELVDGALKVTDPDGSVTVFEMNDNGWISITLEYDEETTLVMYYEKAE